MVFELLVDGDKFRHFLHTGRTPSRPKINQHHLAAQSRQIDLAAVDRGELEVERRGAHIHQLECAFGRARQFRVIVARELGIELPGAIRIVVLHGLRFRHAQHGNPRVVRMRVDEFLDRGGERTRCLLGSAAVEIERGELQKHESGVGAHVFRRFGIVGDRLQFLALSGHVRFGLVDHGERVGDLHHGHACLPAVGALGVVLDELFEVLQLRAKAVGQHLPARLLILGEILGELGRFVLQRFPSAGLVAGGGDSAAET